MLHPSCLASESAFHAPRPCIPLAVCGFLLLAVIAVFGQTAGHDFVNFDDDDYVYENPHVRTGLTGAGSRLGVTACHSSNWHPLTWLSHMLDCQLYRPEARRPSSDQRASCMPPRRSSCSWHCGG